MSEPPPALPDLFAQRAATLGASLAPTGRRVLRFIDQNRAEVLAHSAAELAARIGTSDATVVRTVQALGFSGLAELRRALVATLGRPSTPADDMRRTLDDVGASTGLAVDMVLDAHEEAMASLRSAASRAQIAAAVNALHGAERIAVFGIGPSAPLAAYVALLLGRAGRRSTCLDATGLALADGLLDLRAGDAVLALAYGRAYREVAAVSAEARRLGLPIVLISDGSGFAGLADVVVAIPRGRAQRVALHGATLVGLEALVLGLAAAGRAQAMAALERLNRLRRAVSGQRDDAEP